MDCKNCGACCLNETPGVNKNEITPKKFIDATGGCMKTHKGACIGFDKSARGCQIYKLRPKNCRSLEVGSAECLLSRLWATLELDWFGDAPCMPEEGDFNKFISKVTFGNGLAIISIEGLHSEIGIELIKEYNKQLIAETT